MSISLQVILFALLFIIQKDSVYCSFISNSSVCDTDFDELTYDLMRSGGSCEPYRGGSVFSICDNYFNPGIDYVYIPQTRTGGSQLSLRDFTEKSALLLNFVQDPCRDELARVLCNYYYYPCGVNGTLTVPQYICSDVCHYVSSIHCMLEWVSLSAVVHEHVRSSTNPRIRNDPTLLVPRCNETDLPLSFLDLSGDCCTNGGLILPGMKSSVISSNIQSPTTPTTPTTSSMTGISLVTSSSVSESNTQSNPEDTSSMIIIISTTVASAVLMIILLVSALMLLVAFILRRKINYKGENITEQVPNSYVPLPETGSHDTVKSLPGFFCQNDLLERMTYENGKEFMVQLGNLVIIKENLDLVEKIGEGEFGLVFRGLLLQNESLVAVAVKTLKGMFTEKDIESIKEETLKMSQFDHINVLSLIGVCLDAGPAPLIIMPYMNNGSLLSYLKKERANMTLAKSVDIEIIKTTKKQLLSMCLQVCNGMSYLARNKFVHRDLAARNCMIDDKGVIKVADFGLTEDIYTKNYFKQLSNSSSTSNTKSGDSVKLPVKWMALESLHDGIFSEKSDVWSYGVLSWEIFSLGKNPYPGLGPRDVIETLDKGDRLKCPTNAACTDDIYLMMNSCWREEPEDRPTFIELSQEIDDLIKPLADYFELSIL